MKFSASLLFGACVAFCLLVDSNGNEEFQTLGQIRTSGLLGGQKVTQEMVQKAVKALNVLTSDKVSLLDLDLGLLKDVCTILQLIGTLCNVKDTGLFDSEMSEMFAAVKNREAAAVSVGELTAGENVLYDALTVLEIAFSQRADQAVEPDFLEGICVILRLLGSVCANIII